MAGPLNRVLGPHPSLTTRISKEILSNARLQHADLLRALPGPRQGSSCVSLEHRPTAVTHQVFVRPKTRSAKRQYYEVILDGAVIVSKSADPVHAACRAMMAIGLSGRVEFYRPGDPYPSLIVHDLDKAAMLRVVETKRVGPVIKKWRPFEMKGHLADHAAKVRR